MTSLIDNAKEHQLSENDYQVILQPLQSLIKQIASIKSIDSLIAREVDIQRLESSLSDDLWNLIKATSEETVEKETKKTIVVKVSRYIGLKPLETQEDINTFLDQLRKTLEEEINQNHRVKIQ